jgi:hypothetical protein
VNLSEGSYAYALMHITAMVVGTIAPRAIGETSDTDEVSGCIESSRILCALLDRRGIPARPMPVDITVSNMAAHELQQKHIPVSQWPDAAWSVGVNADHTGPTSGPIGMGDAQGWHGHLITRVARSSILDCSAAQFRRPHIPFPGWWKMPWPSEWRNDKSEDWTTFGMSDGTVTPADYNYAVVRIRPRHDNQRFRAGTAWVSDLSGVIDPLHDLIDHIIAGTSGDDAMVTISGRKSVVNVSQVRERWEQMAGQPDA